MDEPRAYTPEEVREEFLATLRQLAFYWSQQSEHTAREMCDGVIFSVLNIFDGTAMGLPAMDIVLRPHPDDANFLENDGENWYEDGMAINDFDGLLHEIYYRKPEAAP